MFQIFSNYENRRSVFENIAKLALSVLECPWSKKIFLDTLFSFRRIFNLVQPFTRYSCAKRTDGQTDIVGLQTLIIDWLQFLEYNSFKSNKIRNIHSVNKCTSIWQQHMFKVSTQTTRDQKQITLLEQFSGIIYQRQQNSAKRMKKSQRKFIELWNV